MSKFAAKFFRESSYLQRSLWWCAFALFVSLLLMSLIFQVAVKPASLSMGFRAPQEPQPTIQSALITNGEIFSQIFYYHGIIQGLFISLHLGECDLSSATISVSLYEENSSFPLATEQAFLNSTVQNDILKITFSEPITCSDGKYRLELVPHGLSGVLNPISYGLAEYSRYTETAARLGTRVQAGPLAFSVIADNHFLIITFLIGSLGLILLAIVLIFFRWSSLENFFLVLSLGIGTILLFVQVPLYGFDINFHKDSAYILSNQLLFQDGVQERTLEDGTIQEFYLRRACDDLSSSRNLPRFCTQDLLANYQIFHTSQLSFITKEDEKFVEQPILESHADITYLYLPQAIGFSIARLLHLNQYWLICLGRIFNYLFFIFLSYAAIRTTPFLKPLFFCLSLLPICLSQSISLSRDSMLISLSFFVVAQTFRLAYTNRAITLKEMLKLFVPALLLAPCKLVYLPISFLWLIIPFKRWGTWRLPRKWILFIIIGSLSILIFFGNYHISRIIERFFFVNGMDRVNEVLGISAAGNNSQTLAYTLTHPLEIFQQLFHAFRLYWGDYLFESVAPFPTDLGLDHTLALIWLTFPFIYTASDSMACNQITRLDRIWYGVISLSVLGLLVVAATQWTPIGFFYLRGLQGRYFTPLFPLIAVTFCASSRRQIRFPHFLFILKAGVCFCLFVFVIDAYLFVLTNVPQ